MTLLFPVVKQLNIDVVDSVSGQNLVVNYGWPEFMCDPQNMLKDAAGKVLPNYHPKVHAIDRALQNYRANIDDLLNGEISLPCIYLFIYFI